MPRKSLQTELLLSHLLLVGLLLLVCLVAVAGFFHLGRSVDRILRDNYKSVVAAQNMKESLERIDSAATFYLAGQTEKARHQYRENLPRFEAAYQVETANITEPGEQAVADGIGQQFSVYRQAVKGLLFTSQTTPPIKANRVYFALLEPLFLDLKGRAQQVLEINQTAIIRADETARGESRRAALLSIAITAVALLLGTGLALRGIRALMTPLVSLTRQAEQIGAGHLNQRIQVRRDDEIGLLAETFNQMAERLREFRRVDEERLHRAERMSDAALENLYDPVIVTDTDGKVVHLNRAAEGLFGPDARARGRVVRDVVRDERLASAIERAVGEAQTSAEEGEASLITFGESRQSAAASARVYRLRASPMRGENSTHLGAVAVLEDVTYQQELDRLKTEFIGVASHELRTPVTSLLLGVQLLEEGAVGPLSAGQGEVVNALRGDLLRLERMMHDLLDLTRLEAGATPPRFEAVPPAELVRTALDTLGAQAQEKGVRLEAVPAAGLPPVRADRGQIGRVLTNLMGNALRHTPKGGSIRVLAEPAEDGNAIRFAVTDTGVGIPLEHQKHIFERFVQVPGATRGGAGLGLSIAQNILRAHGGTIAVESQTGQGSTFWFILPSAESKG